jgi:hypothetical protein
MKNNYLLIMSIVGAALYLSCVPAESPFSNPADATILKDNSLRSLDAKSDSLKAFTTEQCTVSLYLSDLIDSFYVHRSFSGKDTVVAGGSVTDTAIRFPFAVTTPGIYNLKVVIVKTDGTRDSLSRTVTVYSPLSPTLSFVLPATDSVTVRKAYACSLAVTNVELVDSFTARLRFKSIDTVIARGRPKTGISFTFVVPVAGGFSVRVGINKFGGGADSVTKNLIGSTLTPVVRPDSTAYHIVLPADSLTFKFSVTDPDSNVWKAFTWFDTASGAMLETSFPPKTHKTVISRTIKASALLAGLKAPIVCSAVAIDFPDSNVSSIAICTLYVKDTLAPKIALLTTDTATAITALPKIIMARVTDIAGIVSATFNGSPMTLKGDTAVFEAASLDSGKHLDSIVAVDGVGNKSRLLFSLVYTGKQLFPPQIKDLSMAVPETKKFDTLFLDTCVIIKDSTITNKTAYARDSISWTITDSSGAKIDTATHKITVPQPADSEWVGTIKISLKAMVKNQPTLYDTKQPSFFITEVPDKPVIQLGQSWCSRTPYSDTIYLDTVSTVRDPDNAPATLNWKFSKGKHFKVDSLYKSIFNPTLSKTTGGPIIIRPEVFTRKVRIGPISVADTSFYGTDTLTMTVTDPGALFDTKPLYFTRSPKCLFIFFP